MRNLVFIVLLLIPAQAIACMSTYTNDPEKVIERAVFIGKVKILEKKDAKTKLLPLEIYKGEIKEPFLANIHSFTTCGKNIPPEGTIYEEIIFEYEEGKYITSAQGSLLRQKEWSKLRDNSQTLEALEEILNSCNETNGSFSSEFNGISLTYDCYHSSKDWKQHCDDNNNCEGVCLAELNSEEKGEVEKMKWDYDDSHPDKPKPVYKTGECSRYTDLKGCYYIVEKGEVRSRTCLTENFK